MKAYDQLSKHPNLIYLLLPESLEAARNAVKGLGNEIDFGRTSDSVVAEAIKNLPPNQVMVSLGENNYGHVGFVVRSPDDWGFFRDSLRPVAIVGADIEKLKPYLKSSDLA